MDLGIKQRIALISGGDSGMGKETARQLLEAGVRVAITDLPNGTLDQAVAELSGLGEIIAIEGDVTQEQDVTRIWGCKPEPQKIPSPVTRHPSPVTR
ncbi:SDR family NAD(P)-dependent oxidoreductase, partial [Xanthomonas phaseoli]